MDNNKPLPPPPPSDLGSGNPSLSTLDERPSTLRRATAPDSTDTLSPFSSLPSTTLPIRPRTRSPFAKGHARSRSSGSLLRAPPMTRTYSSPTPESTVRPSLPRPASPLGPSSRHRSPIRKPSEDSFSSFGNDLDIDQTISENAELEVTPRATTEIDFTPTSPSFSSHHTFPRSRRRPMSPLSHIQQGSSTPRTPLRASASTPSLANSHYNEAYPVVFSMPSSTTSTPTSIRSRSPSISSLETIPDSPDAEREAENIAKLRAAADQEEQSEEGARRRLNFSSDTAARGARDKRKRWSVCGAERRGDLDLETIYEDGS